MIDFNNLKIAFADKSDADLNRAYLLFKSMKNRFLSKILTGLVQFLLKLHIPIKFIIHIYYLFVTWFFLFPSKI